MAVPPEPGRNSAGQRVLPTSVTRPKPKPRVVKKAAPVPGQTGAGSGPSPARKPKASTPTQVKLARGQAQQYASQGKAVRRVADRQEQARQLAEDRQHAAAQHDILTAQDIQKRDAYEKAHPVGSEYAKYVPNYKQGLAKAQGGGVFGKLTGLNVKKALDHIDNDAAEIAVTTPSSVAKLSSTLVHHPAKVPGMLVEPYKQLVKDPKNFIENHPVSAGLMLSPAARMPGLAVGRVARLAGKQTLARTAATLPGTALKEARTGSRDFTIRQMQARKDAKTGTPVMSTKQIQKRTDEFFDVGQKHKQRVAVSAKKEGQRRFADLPKAERKVALQEHVSGAKGDAQGQVDKKFAEEFGSNYQRTPQGTILKPKQASPGVLHANKADADAIAARVPFDAKVKQVGEKYAVVPKVAAERLYGGGEKKVTPHATVGTSRAPGALVLRTAGKSFRTAVLPLSAKWLFGQAGEAGLRSAIAGVGPTSLLRESRVFKELERQAPGKGIEMRQRTSSGGQFGLQGTAREFANGRTLAQEFEGTGLEKPANVLSKGAAAPGVRHVRRGFRAYSHVVFNVVNDAIEKTAQRGMTGRALKQGPLMDHRIIGLSDKAIGEAAQGLKATENQVALGRAVDRMYGQYSKFSPGKRETLLHTTPFYPWYRNVVTFLTKVLPVDHPVLTGLIASTNVLEEDWRKKHGLSLLDPNHKPGFLLGGYPAKGGKVTRLSRYTPFGATAEPLQGVADLAVPQFAGIRDNLKGLDWTGKPLKGNPLSNAGLTAAETHIPGVAQVDRVTGLGDKYVRKLDKPTILSGKDLKAALLKEVNPLMAAGAGSASTTGPSVKVAPVRVKPVRVKPIRIKPVKVR